MMNNRDGWAWRGIAFGVSLGAATLVGCAGSTSSTGGAEQPLIETAQLDIENPDAGSDADFDSRFDLLSQAVQNSENLSIDGYGDGYGDGDRYAASSDGLRPEEMSSTPAATGSPGARSQTGASIESPPDAVEQPVEVASDEGAETLSDGQPDDGLARGTGGPAAPTLDDQIEEAVLALRQLIEDSGDRALSPLGAMLRVALLESVQPGVFEAAYGSLDQATERAGLTPDEREVLASTLEMASSLRGELDPGTVDIDRLVNAIDDASVAMRAVRMLTVEDARLCLRVDNFGVYREFERYDDRYKFIAGRAHPVIVYSELDHFTRRPSSRDGVEGYVVNVTQGLKLYRTGTADAPDSENTLAWQMDAEPVVDFSRRPLRDFFVVQVTELPANLSIGSYRLKVIATDVASGEESERAIEFDVVADSSALRGPSYTTRADTGPYNPNR